MKGMPVVVRATMAGCLPPTPDERLAHWSAKYFSEGHQHRKLKPRIRLQVVAEIRDFKPDTSETEEAGVQPARTAAVVDGGADSRSPRLPATGQQPSIPRKRAKRAGENA